MVKPAALSELIGVVYDASLDPRLWPEVLRRVADFIEGCAAVLYSHDVVHASGRFHFNWGDNPDYTRAYFERYIRLNPLAPHFMMAAPGDVVVASRMMPYEELVASQFFQEWCAPQGYTDFVAATLDKSSTSVATLSVGRDMSQNLVDDAMIHRMTLLAPHVRRAVAIGKVIDLAKVEAAAFGDTIDGLAAAVLLVDEHGAIVFANRSAETMLEEGQVVRRAGDSLCPVDNEAADAMRSAFRAAAGGDTAVAVKGIAVPLIASDGDRYHANILPLTSGSRRQTGVAYAAVAAVFLRKAELDVPGPIELVAKTYRLTGAEIRVLYAVLECGGGPSAARMLGLSSATVKTHLHNLFEKTGTKGQTDLVKLVAGFASPLAG
ncbi:MAG: helix-turn-helix transcriptional regulator [Methyloceanibacter sp.]|uniref:helix-turn-helix transcriptional regulator n=1 Tax=Methyloceanibacter sp. TaxID=1965321 RepID=UPI003D6CCE94